MNWKTISLGILFIILAIINLLSPTFTFIISLILFGLGIFFIFVYDVLYVKRFV